MKSPSVTTQVKATEQYYLMVMFIKLYIHVVYKVVPLRTFQSKLSCHTFYYVIQGGSSF